MNKDQALVPSKCTVLHNAVGTAPGMWMKSCLCFLTRVPYEKIFGRKIITQGGGGNMSGHISFTKLF
jgi:hypothetical protein